MSRTARLVGIVDVPHADTAIERTIVEYQVEPNERWRLKALRRD